MKTILVPTDYSEVANNALQYAIEYAKFSNSKLLLFHVYPIPVPTTEFSILHISKELEKKNAERLKNLENEIRKKGDETFQIESKVGVGDVTDNILNLTTKKKIDLVVMGITGTNKLASILIGSNTMSVIEKSTTPVLIIPPKTRFKKIEKIVFASDFNHIVPKKVVVKLKEFAHIFDAEILVLDVLKSLEEVSHYTKIAGVNFENQMKGVSVSFHFSVGENLKEEINLFIEKHQASILVMLHKKYGILEQLFHKSNTKQMASHTQVPLISIHE